ncbi:uncharacterized protein LOC128172280 [Crassostrea angulata]|uniref:uncharacterized protein LOC128172280 n=1 Tax=Magallana angulata TaxID=2784310 RepID=UPI0022B1BB2D|nr:uncharacterized protein LOC128172280 [Crassostrea angulata]
MGVKMWKPYVLFLVLAILVVAASATEKIHKSPLKPKDLKEKSKNEVTETDNEDGKNEATARKWENKIDQPDIDPDDPDMRLFLSMGVGVDGAVKHSKGLHPENSKRLQARRLDKPDDSEKKTENKRKPSRKPKRRRKRNFGPNWGKWPKGIVPYVFDASLDVNRGYFLQAIELFDNFTCVKWKPKSPEVAAEVGHQGYVLVRSGTSCSSGVGFQGDVEHIINFKEPGCGWVDVAVHEMLHRIGQRHEHARSDRDRYVKINWDNIHISGRYNYYRLNTYNRNPYDIGSVMHYGYSSSETADIELKDKNLNFLEFPGSQIFSYYDLKDVIDQYQCAAHCISPPVCKNGGYVNANCQCTCPEGFSGVSCDTVVTDPDCGGYVHLKENDLVLEREKVAFITSPNYPGPIGLGKICRWAVTVPVGYIVKMTIDDLHMAYNPDTLRCYHWLEIQYNLPGQQGIRRCGDIVGETFLSSIDSPTLMIITMDTKLAGGRVTKKGFKLHVEKEREVCRDSPCVFGICVPTERKSYEYKCVCQPGYTGDKCDQVVDGAKLKCSFERFEKCFFDNVQEGDEFEWGPGFRHTISEWTGPEDAFRGERFIFAEMSLPRVPGDTAILQTTVALPEQAGCLSYAYNMFGSTVYKLTLFAEGTNSPKYVLWSKEGNQGSDWLTAKVDVPAIQGLKLSFEAVTGDSWDSDIALDEITWETGQCGPDTFNDCLRVGEEYDGTLNYTKRGVACQAWSSNTPHTPGSQYAYLASDSNYCRIADEPDPWCYTTDAGTRWDWCSIPYCFATECAYTPTGMDYMGTVSHTKTGIPCQRWDSQSPHPHSYGYLSKDENYCRNTDGSEGPWCYTQDPDIRYELCDVPVCEKIEQECLMTSRGLDYAGKQSVTNTGKTCEHWTDEQMSEDENYCRNPDQSVKPWCYVQSGTGLVKEYCDIPSCADSPCFPNPCKNRGECSVEGTSYSCTCLNGFSGDNCETQELGNQEDCKRSSNGWDYSGKRNVTQSGRTCQVWSAQSPHSHGYTSYPENYCRNPDGEPSPWCYTTDPYKRWELCAIPDCVSPPLECLPNSDLRGTQYYGTQSVTETGDTCQRWDSQSPYTHSFSYLGDQENYCRNPDNDLKPWCYTTNVNRRYGYCNVPYC